MFLVRLGNEVDWSEWFWEFDIFVDYKKKFVVMRKCDGMKLK